MLGNLEIYMDYIQKRGTIGDPPMSYDHQRSGASSEDNTGQNMGKDIQTQKHTARIIPCNNSPLAKTPHRAVNRSQDALSVGNDVTLS